VLCFTLFSFFLSFFLSFPFFFSFFSFFQGDKRRQYALHTFSCNGKMLSCDTECGLVTDLAVSARGPLYVTGTDFHMRKKKKNKKEKKRKEKSSASFLFFFFLFVPQAIGRGLCACEMSTARSRGTRSTQTTLP
jgi:hypothetical protein